LAERLLRDGERDDAGKIDRLFEWVVARRPDDSERQSVMRVATRMRERWTAAPDDAIRVAGSGERWRDAFLDPIEVATWAMVSNLILNLDETLTRN
jgi:hypothetical protein